MKKVLITGITGQDGAYLAEYLLKKNFKIYGVLRRTSSQKFKRLERALRQYRHRLLADRQTNFGA